MGGVLYHSRLSSRAMFSAMTSAKLLLLTGVLRAAAQSRQLRALASTNNVTVQISSSCGDRTGQCSENDFKVMWDMGPGTSSGTFPKKNADCGRASYSIFWGFNKDKFVSCMSGTGLSGSCSGCFAGAAQYGTINCKVACITSWSSSGCLSCTGKYTSSLETCVGEASPGTDPADTRVLCVTTTTTTTRAASTTTTTMTASAPTTSTTMTTAAPTTTTAATLATTTAAAPPTTTTAVPTGDVIVGVTTTKTMRMTGDNTTTTIRSVNTTTITTTNMDLVSGALPRELSCSSLMIILFARLASV